MKITEYTVDEFTSKMDDMMAKLEKEKTEYEMTQLALKATTMLATFLFDDGVYTYNIETDKIECTSNV